MPELEERLLASGGPQTQGTKADSVKWHDDKVRQGRPLVLPSRPGPASSQGTCLGADSQLRPTAGSAAHGRQC